MQIRNPLEIDLTTLPKGERYEDTYGGYMQVFETIARTLPGEEVRVINPPYSWVPLLRYLGCHITGGQYHFDHCTLVSKMLSELRDSDRTAIEVLCGFRPECIDALWKCDMQWRSTRPAPREEGAFIVTTNGGMHRPEVLDYMKAIDECTIGAHGALVVPCAADKPYPSPLHEKMLTMLPDGWELLVSSGVFGLVPASMWDTMPHYDAGMPNEWRLFNRTQEFFDRHRGIETVVCYVDYNCLALQEAFDVLTHLHKCPEYYFVNEVKYYFDYLDLLSVNRLVQLQEVLHDANN